jgi:hypothetical protein
MTVLGRACRKKDEKTQNLPLLWASRLIVVVDHPPDGRSHGYGETSNHYNFTAAKRSLMKKPRATALQNTVREARILVVF